MKIAIHGAAGRMGKMLIKAINQNKNTKLVGLIEHSQSEFLGKTDKDLIGEGSGEVVITDNLIEATRDADVIIDFSRPNATINLLKHLDNKKLVIGTTGFSEEEKQKINDYATQNATVFASNFSIGVNLCFALTHKAAKVLTDFDSEIIEAHHRYKIDAPSGTALSLGEEIAKAKGKSLKELAVFDRTDLPEERMKDAIGFAVVRAGNIVGEHTALFASDNEIVEIKHIATDRIAFAQGAVVASLFLEHKTSGLFNMQDVLDLK